jgi:hypothetical protein
MEIIEFILMLLSVVVLCSISFDIGAIKATLKRIEDLMRK